MTTLQLAAPISGWATPLEEIPDPAFAQKMVGDGIAIDPTSSELRAPCDGVIVSLHEAHHACIVRCREGVEVLLHVGIDTVGLSGEGFSPLTRAGKSVKTGDPLIAFDMDLLARKARGLFTMMIVMNSDAYAIADKVQGRAVTAGEPLLALRDIAAPSTRESAGETVARSAVLRVAHGLHARPAAIIAERAKRHEGVVRIARKGRAANGKSVAALMALGARDGDTLTIDVQGSGAAHLAEELVTLLGRGLPQGEARAVTSPVASSARLAAETSASTRPENARAAQAPVAAPPFPPHREVLLHGVAAVAGMAQGYAARAFREAPEIAKDGCGVANERRALLDALRGVRRDLDAALDAALLEGLEASILEVHLSLLDDPEIIGPANDFIDLGRSAAWAWKAAVERYAAALGGLDDPLLAERASDLRDVESRVIAFLDPGSGARAPGHVPANAVLIADELRPSDLAAGARGRIVAACTARGGPTSHGAIIAAGMGIPVVVALGDGIFRVPEGAPLIVDGDRGHVHAFPSEATRRATVDEMLSRAARHEANRAARYRDCRTRDGARIEVLANVGRPEDAAEAMANGAEGCGLLRTEFLFLERTTAPSADEQTAQYRAIADTLGRRPFAIRTIDVGADKALPYLPAVSEENPALGLRGIRFALRHPELLRTQIRAIARVETSAPLRILVPMVSCLAELEAVRAILDAECRAARIDDRIELGAMIEVPIAAICSDVLSTEADFISIGTNDLTQYGAAADRGNPLMTPYLDSLHPGSLRLVAQAVAGARARNRPVAVCGAIASDARAAALLVGLGVTELSVTPSVIADIKAFIATLALSDCAEIAVQALALSSADEVRALLNRTWPVI